MSQLEEVLFHHDQFAAFDDFIIKSDVKALEQTIRQQNVSAEELTRLGYTLSWLSNGFHHTEGFRPKEKEINFKRFDQVYALCEKVLDMAKCDRANHELAEMYYRYFSTKRLKFANRFLKKNKIPF